MSRGKKSSGESRPAEGVFSNLLDESAPGPEAVPTADPPAGEVSDTISDEVAAEAAGEESRTGSTLDGVGFTLPWPPKPAVSSASQVQTTRPDTGETEGLARDMPDIGALPFAAREDGELRVVRLVSSATDSDLSIELQPGLNKIGRQRNDNHIVLVSPDISRFHAQIVVSDDAIEIADLGSSNGTFVNGRRVQEKNLEAGDMVAFSDEFSFQVLIDLPLSSPKTLTLSEEPAEPRVDRDTAPEAPQEGWSRDRGSMSDLMNESWDSAAPSDSEPLLREPTPPPGVAQRPPTSTTRPGRQSPREDPRRERTPPQPPTPMNPGRTTGPELDLLPEANDLLPEVDEPLPEVSQPLAPEEVAEPEPPTGLVDEDTHLSSPGVLPEGHPSEVALTIPASEELVLLERERRQLAVLYQVTKRCLAASDLEELDRLLINVLERMVSFQRAFITYRLKAGDWKLVMSKHKYHWDKEGIRRLLHLSRRTRQPLVVHNSQEERGLGTAEDGLPDTRLLLPLWANDFNMGAVFLVSQLPNSFESTTLSFLEQFADVAALALFNGARL